MQSAHHGQPLDNLVDDASLEVDVDPDGLHPRPATGRPRNEETHVATIGCELPHLLQVVLDPASSPDAVASLD